MSEGFLTWTRPRRLTWRRMVLALALCAAVTITVIVLAPLFGIEPGPRGWHLVVLDLDAAFTPGSIDGWALWQVRVPRVLAAALVGAALGGAGSTFQAVLRNPLADPFTLGVSSGSSLAAVLAIRFGVERALGGSGVGAAAMIGAAAAVLVVWQLGRVGGSLPPATLLLAGLAISMFCSAASMLVEHGADFVQVHRMVHWMMGGFDSLATGYLPVVRATPPILVGLGVLLWLGRDLNALAAGPEAAASVGVSPGRAQTLGFLAASIVVGASIAVSGPIGFVGLMVPHTLRALLGPDHRVLVPASMLIGAAFLVACDLAAQVAVPGDRLPVGAVTALLGGPFFIGILIRHKRRASLWSPG